MAEQGAALRGVIVTGGTGALGRAVTEAFLKAGDRVVVPWIVKEERDQVEVIWRSWLERERLRLVEADVSEEEGARRVLRELPLVEVLVNGVGGFGGGTSVHETELELWDRMFRINVRSAVSMCRAALPGMLARRRGCVICVASRAAQDLPAGIAAYSAAKAALIALVGTLQKEVSAAGLRVNAVVPTTIDTPANRAAMPDADFSSWTAPERIAQAMVWLASDAGSSVRGGLIPV